MSDTKERQGRGLDNLSPQTVNQLTKLRESDRDSFYRTVASLRLNGWPLRAIATPLGVSRSIVAMWEKKANSTDNLPTTEPLPERPEKKPVVKETYEIEDDQQQVMYNLAREASMVRRYTDLNSPSRRAARELEDLLHHHSEQGASLSQLAKACGVSRRAVAQRLEKRNK